MAFNNPVRLTNKKTTIRTETQRAAIHFMTDWMNLHVKPRLEVNKVTLFARSNAIGCIILIGGRGGRRIIAYICFISVQ